LVGTKGEVSREGQKRERRIRRDKEESMGGGRRPTFASLVGCLPKSRKGGRGKRERKGQEGQGGESGDSPKAA
jgi:hypothetical protein